MTETRKSRKQEILAAALACFTEFGAEATTVDMIRERSGASVGSMYHHFGSKESIAAALYVESLQEHGDLQARLLGKARTAEEGVKAIVRAYVDWVAANPDKARFVLYSRSVVARSEVGADVQARTSAHVAEVMKWFEPHVQSGALKDLPREIYGSLVTGPAHDYARLWLSGRAKTDIRKYREVFAAAAWNAVRP